jgi:putative sigma-54 modulation protein
MQINIQSINHHASAELDAFVARRLEKLKSFHDRITTADVYLKQEVAEPGLDKCAEIKVQLPGLMLFGKACKKSFEEATDAAVESLRKQIIRVKERASAVA